MLIDRGYGLRICMQRLQARMVGWNNWREFGQRRINEMDLQGLRSDGRATVYSLAVLSIGPLVVRSRTALRVDYHHERCNG
jgi:hypothetical protein